MRRCRSSAWTRISPPACSGTGGQWWRGHHAKDARLDDGAYSVPQVERPVAEREEVVEPARGPRAQAARRLLGQAAHDEPRQRPGQQREVLERDAVAAGERG